MDKVIESYEKKIKMLGDLLKQKDLEISDLKQKLNINNNMNINQINNNINDPIKIIIPNNEEILNSNENQMNLIVKSGNNKFDFFCYPKYGASILKEKFKNFSWNFVYNFIRADFAQTFEQNGIKDSSIIEIKRLN